MKKIVVGIMVAMLAITACQKKNKKAPINTTSDRGKRAAPTDPNNPNNPNPSNGSFKLSGLIFSQDQSNFLSSVKGFLSVLVDEKYVGDVSGSYDGDNDGTGVYFGGLVRLQSGALQVRGGMPRTDISAGSRIAITVIDEYANTGDSEGNKAPQMAVNLVEASGYVQGNQAYLKFWDEYGSVELVGEFDETYFDGRISYDNEYMWDGSRPGAADDLGYFRIRTCTFFECK